MLEALEYAWAEWTKDRGATGKLTQGAIWRRDNPGEWTKLKGYRDGTAPRPQLTSVTGRHMVFETDAWLEAAEPKPILVYPSVSRYPSEVL